MNAGWWFALGCYLTGGVFFSHNMWENLSFDPNAQDKSARAAICAVTAILWPLFPVYGACLIVWDWWRLRR